MTSRNRSALPWLATAIAACALVVVVVIAAAMWLGRDTTTAEPTEPIPGTPVDTPGSQKYRDHGRGNYCELMDLAELTRHGSAAWRQTTATNGYCAGEFGDLQVSLNVRVTRPDGDRRRSHDQFKELVGNTIAEPDGSFEYLTGLGEDAFVAAETGAFGRPPTKVRIGVLDENLEIDTTLVVTSGRITSAELRQLTEQHVRAVMGNVLA
ncbi:hypothetical protein [Nocardia sp. AG03]|uniref:hypothetical protein n=1 Tax=Nocardia sp. AG03 TaxID=3025312 RepID=UPI002418240D|nr:hypothetical protein [Nocardia sp. AG03]